MFPFSLHGYIYMNLIVRKTKIAFLLNYRGFPLFFFRFISLFLKKHIFWLSLFLQNLLLFIIWWNASDEKKCKIRYGTFSLCYSRNFNFNLKQRKWNYFHRFLNIYCILIIFVWLKINSTVYVRWMFWSIGQIGFLSIRRIVCPNPNTQTVYAIDKCDTQQQTNFQNLINAGLLAFISYTLIYIYICYNVGIVSLWMEILLSFFDIYILISVFIIKYSHAICQWIPYTRCIARSLIIWFWTFGSPLGDFIRCSDLRCTHV